MLDKIKEKIRSYMLEKADFITNKDKFKEKELQDYVLKIIKEIANREHIHLSSLEENKLLSQLMDEFVSLGPLKPLIDDRTITEIMINGPRKVYIERNGRIELTPITFNDDEHLRYTIQKIISASGRRVDESSPYVDFSLIDGSRVNIILPPVSLEGSVVTIRKFSPEISKIEDLLRLNSLNEKMADFLVASIKAKLNIVFSGATGTGKTTTLNVLSSYIPQEERIITIEDTSELRMHQEHVVRLQARPPNIEGKGEITIREIFRNSLRMRPDRIILGEVRSSEALDMIQAITSGHTGSLAIVHANSPQDAILRLETMILMSGIELSVTEIRRSIAKAIDLIVHMEHFMDGSRRITYITEVRFIKNNEIELNDIFYFAQERILDNGEIIGKWVLTPNPPLFLDKFQKRNIKFSTDLFK